MSWAITWPTASSMGTGTAEDLNLLGMVFPSRK
jgi:hypothetical protein